MKPTDIPWDRIHRFHEFCHRLCLLYNGSQTSGPRSAKRNAEKGGHPLSKHTFKGGWGAAWDIVFDYPSILVNIKDLVEQEGYTFVAEDHYVPGQCHIQLLPYGVKPGDENA